MKNIHRYDFYKKKYGADLLADVITIAELRKYIQEIPTHRLTYFDLTFITQGNEYLTINQKKVQVQAGDVICSTPADVWTWGENTTLEGLKLIFEEDFFQSFFINKLFLKELNFLKSDRLSPLIKPNDESFVEMLAFLEKIKTEIHEKDRSEDIIRAFVYLVLAKLEKEEKRQDKSTLDALSKLQNNRHLQAFIKLVEENYLDKHEVQFYADKLFISTNYLNKIVQELLGTSTKKYVLNKVIQEAKNLLSYTNLSIAEISDTLKFESPSYFTRIFYHYAGIKPSTFRNGNKPK